MPRRGPRSGSSRPTPESRACPARSPSMACSTSPCSPAGASMRRGCRRGSTRSSAPRQRCPRVVSCGSSPSGTDGNGVQTRPTGGRARARPPSSITAARASTAVRLPLHAVWSSPRSWPGSSPAHRRRRSTAQTEGSTPPSWERTPARRRAARPLDG